MTDALLTDTARRVFADTCGFAAVERAELDGFAPAVWRAVTDTGLAWVSVPEAAGGSGGSVSDALDLVRIAGSFGAPIPLAETGLLAGWLTAGVGATVPGGPATVVPGTRDDDLTWSGGVLRGTAHRVPWARAADQLVGVVERDGAPAIVFVPASAVRVEPSANLAGEPRDTVLFDDVVVDAIPAPAGVDAHALRARGALARVAAMSGALDRLCEVTVSYTSERRQFGKAVASFQAVQAHLVHAAQDAAIVAMALHTAARAYEQGDAWFEIAAAKVLANQSASSATRHAHQAHGAMGMTREYPLHHLTRRLWSWRSEFGDERTWSRALGAAVVDASPDLLYPAITGGSTALLPST
jgi:acyl-CoA dehydrogenase